MAKDYSHLGFVSEDEEQPMPSPTPSPTPAPEDLLSELGFVADREEPSTADKVLETLGAGAAGAAQGFSFGTATKALGALEAIAEQEDLSDLEKLYEKYQELSTKRKREYEELAARNKIASTVGEVGGMLINPVPGAAAKALVNLAGGAKLAKALQVAPKFVERVGAGGILGAGTTAVQSEAEGTEYAKDIAKGTGYGMLAGVGEHGLAKAGTAAKEYIQKSPKIQRIIRAFELSKGTPFEMNPEGKPMKITEEVTREGGGPSMLFDQLNFVKQEMTKSFRNMYNLAKDEFNEFFEQNGKKILNPDDAEISSIIKTLNDNKKVLKKEIGGDLVEKLTNLNQTIDPSTGVITTKNFEGTVSDLYDLRRALLDNIDELMKTEKGLDRDTINILFGKGTEKGIVGAIDDTLARLFPDVAQEGVFQKGYTTLKNNIDTAASPLEQVLNKTLNQEARAIRLSDLSDSKSTEMAEKAFDQMLQRFGPAYGDAKQRYVFNEMINKYEDVLGHLYENSPKFRETIKKGAKIVKLKEPTSEEFKASKEQINKALAEIRKNIKDPVAQQNLQASIADTDQLKLFDFEKAEEAAKKSGKDLFETLDILPSTEAERLGVSIGKDISAVRTALGERSTQDTAQGIKDLFSVPTGSGEALEFTTKGAAALGSATRGVQEFAKGLPGYVKTPVAATVRAPVTLKNATTDQLKQYAEILTKSDNPSVSNIGRAAIQGLEENPAAKGAFINMAMQNPTIRQLLGLSADRSKMKEKE